MRADELARYIRDDAERWYAIHARRRACETAIDLLVEALVGTNKDAMGDFIQSLAYVEEIAVKENDHGAFLETVRRWLDQLSHHVEDMDRPQRPKPQRASNAGRS